MKRLLLCLAVAACLLVLPLSVNAYDVIITDPVGDQIGDTAFDTTQIAYNVNTNPFVVSIITNYEEAGYTVGNWDTLPADLILWGTESSPPALAIPLISHDGFIAGHLYEVTSWYTSDDIAAANGISSSYYTWGFGENVWIKSGTDTGFAGTIAWEDTGLTYTANGWYWTDTNPEGDYLKISWGTSTCANDMVGVPEPTTMLLLGFGLLGLGFARRKS